MYGMNLEDMSIVVVFKTCFSEGTPQESTHRDSFTNRLIEKPLPIESALEPAHDMRLELPDDGQ